MNGASAIARSIEYLGAFSEKRISPFCAQNLMPPASLQAFSNHFYPDLPDFTCLIFFRCILRGYCLRFELSLLIIGRRYSHVGYVALI